MTKNAEFLAASKSKDCFFLFFFSQNNLLLVNFFSILFLDSEAALNSAFFGTHNALFEAKMASAVFCKTFTVIPDTVY